LNRGDDQAAGPNRVLMVGTALDGHGGVASVLRTWRDAGLFERAGVRYVATNGDRGGAGKVWLALRAWVLCAGLMLNRRVALVHVHTSSYISFWRKSPILALALLTRIPLVVSLHGGAFREFYAGRGTLGRRWIRLVMRRAARFVVLTNEWRMWAGQVEPRTRVAVIPNTVADLGLKSGDGPGSPSEVRGPLLFLGRIEHDKGLWILIKALARARAVGANWALVCAGSGDIAGAQVAAKEAGLSDETIRFVGWVDGGVKADWLARCEALVLPSLIENMPVSILEAYAHAKPVIASRVGGIPDMLDDGCEGTLVTAGDVDALAQALIQAWYDGANWRAAGLRARQRFERDYACDAVVTKVSQLYAELLRPD
jgi:glycosyltransferase involved in cell wall biosynthesis